MAMNIQDKFNNQWRDIQNVVLSDAKRQIKFHGKVNKDNLTKKLEQETCKWQRGVLVRGVLYSELAKKNISHALLFAETAGRLTFTEPAKNKIPSTWWLTALCLVPAAIISLVLLKFTELDLTEQILYPTLSFVIINALCVPIRNKITSQAENDILSDIERQMSSMKSVLEQYL